jgi:uncharacterized membrane protein YkoI
MLNHGMAGHLTRALTLLLLIGSTNTAVADDVDRVRQLRNSDSILPLSTILVGIEHRFPGTLLEVELEDEHGQVFYELEMLGRDHVIRTIKVDARSGRVLTTDRD